jgi:hypothetical protein
LTIQFRYCLAVCGNNWPFSNVDSYDDPRRFITQCSLEGAKPATLFLFVYTGLTQKVWFKKFVMLLQIRRSNIFGLNYVEKSLLKSLIIRRFLKKKIHYQSAAAHVVDQS